MPGSADSGTHQTAPDELTQLAIGSAYEPTDDSDAASHAPGAAGCMSLSLIVARSSGDFTFNRSWSGLHLPLE